MHQAGRTFGPNRFQTRRACRSERRSMTEASTTVSSLRFTRAITSNRSRSFIDI